MRTKKILNIENLVIFLTLLATIFILYWRFNVAMVRFFDADEYVHMFRASLLALGEIPYRDFGYFYSPIWIAVLSPAFLFFKDNIACVFLARTINFLVFVSLIFMVGVVGKEISGRRGGVMAAFLVAFLPLGLAKTTEIRPDCLALFFFFWAFLLLLKWEKNLFKKDKLLFWSGMAFGFSTVVLLKTVFGYFGFLVYIFLAAKIFSKKFFRNLFFFHLGAAMPWFFLALVFFLLGIFKEGFNSIFLMPFLITKAYSWIYFVPLFPFRPSDIFYGVGGKSLPWVLNHLTLILGMIGFLFGFRGRVFLLFSFIAFVLPSFYLYRITNVQYYLPFLFILCLVAARTLGGLAEKISLRSKPIFLFCWITFFALFSFAFYRVAQIHSQWNSNSELNEIQKIWSVSNPQDYFYDEAGRHLLRPSGSYFCCEFLGEIQESILLKYPTLISSLKKTETKFLFKNPRLGRLYPADKHFLEENYFPSDVENIWTVGKKINLKKDAPVSFDLFAGGYYRPAQITSPILIDNQKMKEIIFLEKGRHSVESPTDQEIILIYDIWSNLKN